jgi:hypothetical protein
MEADNSPHCWKTARNRTALLADLAPIDNMLGIAQTTNGIPRPTPPGIRCVMASRRIDTPSLPEDAAALHALVLVRSNGRLRPTPTKTV